MQVKRSAKLNLIKHDVKAGDHNRNIFNVGINKNAVSRQNNKGNSIPPFYSHLLFRTCYLLLPQFPPQNFTYVGLREFIGKRNVLRPFIPG